MSANARKFIRKNSSLLFNTKSLLALCIVIAWLPSTYSFIINSLRSIKVILQPLDIDGFPQTTYAGISRVRCAAIAALNPNSTFCSTTSGECIAVNASFPPGYNNTNGIPFHHCFSSKKALFDKAAAMQDCIMNGNCCPQPFQNLTHLGCVYTPVFWWFPLLAYIQARRMCQSLWPTGDLFIKPTNWTAVLSYLDSEYQQNVWVGATRVGNTSSFEWTDGTPVVDGDFGREVVILPYPPYTIPSQQPDKRNKLLMSQFVLKPDCLLVFTGELVNKLADDTCYRWTSYICIIT